VATKPHTQLTIRSSRDRFAVSRTPSRIVRSGLTQALGISNMTDRDLQSRVREWLTKQGFPLELKVARSFQAQKFSVVQSSYYEDFEEGKARETDVVARLYSNYEPEGGAYIAELESYVAVECKSSEKPWVVFKGAPINYWECDAFLSNRHGKRLVDTTKLKSAFSSLLVGHSIAGHSAAMAFTDEGRAFAAMMTAMKAAEHIYKKRIEGDKEYDPKAENPYIPIVHAAVVTSSPIFECSINDKYEMELTQVPKSAIALQYPRNRPDSRESLIVHIVGEPALEEFIGAVKLCHSDLASRLSTVKPEGRDA